VLETLLGWIAAVARSGHLIATSLPEPTSKEAIAACGVEAADGAPDDLLAGLAGDFRRYVAGRPVDFTGHPIDLTGRPPFHRRALLAARRIPYGQVCTYGWLAKQVGSPRAARAAGQAMAANPLPLVIPCHRVVGAGGALTGFGGGLALKRALLQLEGIRCRGDRVLGV